MLANAKFNFENQLSIFLYGFMLFVGCLPSLAGFSVLILLLF